MKGKCFGFSLSTGYLFYLKQGFREYLHNVVIDDFETHNPDNRNPLEIASSPDFYLNVVLEVEQKFRKYFIPLTIENYSTQLDKLSVRIRSLEDKQYPLKKKAILKAFLHTQKHIKDEEILSDVHSFVSRRILDKKLFF